MNDQVNFASADPTVEDPFGVTDPGTIAIDNDIPIPEVKHRIRYPFEQMQVGQSFFVPEPRSKTVRSSVGHYQRRSDSTAEFITRTLTENGVKGIRVWRVK